MQIGAPPPPASLPLWVLLLGQFVLPLVLAALGYLQWYRGNRSKEQAAERKGEHDQATLTLETQLEFNQQLIDENRHLREELDLARKHNSGLWVEVDAARRAAADCERRLLDCQEQRRTGHEEGNLGKAGGGVA